MKLVTIGLLLAAFASCGLGVNAKAAKEYCEELRTEMMGLYNESELKTACECIAGSDSTNTTYTLSCQALCEMCDPDPNICGIHSFTELIDTQGQDYAFGECVEYTQGSFKGNQVCIESSVSNGTKACRISANGVDCSSCEYPDNLCGQEGYQVPFFTANCSNVGDIGVIVDGCTGVGLGDDDILAAYYYAFEVGSCNTTEDQQTEPPETTSGAKRDSQMAVSSIVVAALLFSSLVA